MDTNVFNGDIHELTRESIIEDLVQLTLENAGDDDNFREIITNGCVGFANENSENLLEDWVSAYGDVGELIILNDPLSKMKYTATLDSEGTVSIVAENLTEIVG